MFEIFVLPWIRGFKSMDYETNIMEFSTDWSKVGFLSFW
jgi:hypothetical protein